MANDATFRYLPLTDGKPPLYMWVVAGVMKYVPQVDPLLVGRLITVGIGFLTLVGIYFAAHQLFRNRRVGRLSVILYIFIPFTFFYDRMALADSMLAMFGVWSLGLGVMLIREPRFDLAMILGGVLGLAMLTKTPALFFLLLLPGLAILEWKNVWKYVWYLLVAAGIARVIYSVIFLLPQAYVINLKNYEFIVPFSVFINNPLQFVWGNFQGLSQWEISYLTIPVLILVVLSLMRISRKKILLAGYFLGPFVTMLLFNKVIYPRFLLYYTPMLLVLAAKGLSEFSTRIMWLVLILILISPIYVDYKLLTDPASAPIAGTDSQQYLNSWPAGYGLAETRDFLAAQNKIKQKIVVGDEGTFGLLPYGLQLYQWMYPGVELKSYWPPPAKLPPEHLDYYIIYQRNSHPTTMPLELVAKYRQGNGSDFFQLYRVK